ncbi:MAG: YggS family pyridoxal phosphate-dependent enzyme [Bacteroidota bacterium]
MSQLLENLQHIQAQIADAAVQAGRPADSVRLIAVSKTKPATMVQAAYDAGQRDFGENRVQELQEKQPALPADIRWHLIGSLQRNKVKYIADYIYLIHSVDSERLLAEINKRAAQADRTINCLLQLNISEEDAKSGLDESKAEAILSNIEAYPHIHIKGLMGMAAFTDEEAVVLAQFARLQEASEQFAAQFDHPRISMEELSMGMSGDFGLAIRKGATMVRIGSAVFGQR